MRQQTSLPVLRRAGLVLCHIGFWIRWTLFVTVVVPSVLFCSLLAIVSDFSFETLPREIMQSIAVAARSPAAQEDQLMIKTCRQDVPKRELANPWLQCKAYVLEPVSIEEKARDVGEELRQLYLFLVVVSFFFAGTFGGFPDSWRALKAGLITKE